MKTIKQLLKKVESLQIEVEQLIEVRADYYYEKSEKWQDSEKGEKYLEQTEMISDFNEALICAIQDLDSPLQ